MKLTSFAQSLHDLNVIKDAGLTEVILGHRDYSRFGKLSTSEYQILASRARELGLRVILEWDVLMTETIFAKLTSHLDQLEFDSLRVQDPGAFGWAAEHVQTPLQFVAENGNHNLPGLMAWEESSKGRLERIILSIELPKDKIEEYARALKTPVEVLGLGRILLFYTPRMLLTPLVSETRSYHQELTAMGESEESPHKGFPIIENQHGTFMFHIKDFCILSEARELPVSYLRIDLRWDDIALIKLVSDNKMEECKSLYQQELMRGFYNVNKTDVLFPKLKNQRLQKREGNYLGEVMEAEKASHLAIQVLNARGLKKGDKLKVVHPKGEEFEFIVHSLKNLALEEVESVPQGKMALTQYSSGVWVKSQLFYL
jgi:U32 family peptidase